MRDAVFSEYKLTYSHECLDNFWKQLHVTDSEAVIAKILKGISQMLHWPLSTGCRLFEAFVRMFLPGGKKEEKSLPTKIRRTSHHTVRVSEKGFRDHTCACVN